MTEKQPLGRRRGRGGCRDKPMCLSDMFAQMTPHPATSGTTSGEGNYLYEDDDVGENPSVLPMNYTAIGHFLTSSMRTNTRVCPYIISSSLYPHTRPFFCHPRRPLLSSSCLTRGSIITKKLVHKKSPTPKGGRA